MIGWPLLLHPAVLRQMPIAPSLRKPLHWSHASSYRMHPVIPAKAEAPSFPAFAGNLASLTRRVLLTSLYKGEMS